MRRIFIAVDEIYAICGVIDTNAVLMQVHPVIGRNDFELTFVRNNMMC